MTDRAAPVYLVCDGCGFSYGDIRLYEAATVDCPECGTTVARAFGLLDAALTFQHTYEHRPPARPVVSPPDSTEAVRVAEIQARVNAATEGPWTVTFDGDSYPDDWYGDKDAAHGWIEPHGAYTLRRQDNEFIAHAREDIPYLLALLAARPSVSPAADTLRVAAQTMLDLFDAASASGALQYTGTVPALGIPQLRAAFSEAKHE